MRTLGLAIALARNPSPTDSEKDLKQIFVDDDREEIGEGKESLKTYMKNKSGFYFNHSLGQEAKFH